MSFPKKDNFQNSNYSLEDRYSNLSAWSKVNLFIREIGNERLSKMDLIRVFLIGFMSTILLTNFIQYTGANVSARLVQNEHHNKELSHLENEIINNSLCVQEKEDDEAVFKNVINPVKASMLKIDKSKSTKIIAPNTTKVTDKKPIVVKAKEEAISIPKKESLEKEIDTSIVVSTPDIKPVIKKEKRKVISKTLPVVLPKVKTSSSWTSIQKKGISKGKASFLIFGAVWCAPCKMMNKSIQQNQNLQAYLSANQVYKYIDIDTQEGKLLQLQHQISSLPSIVFFDKYGSVIHKEEGALSSFKLFDILKSHDTTKINSNIADEDGITKNVTEIPIKESLLDSNQSVILNEMIDNIIENRVEKE